MTIADGTAHGQSDQFQTDGFRLRVAVPLIIGLAVAFGLCSAYGVVSVWVRDSELWRNLDAPAVRTWWLGHATQCGAEALVAGWFFVLGGCLGSFLNVVIYRLPRRQTLLGHSQCPYCQTRIRARDNIPVWGWVRRGGRCFQCRLPISVRYPTVELTVAYLCLVLAILEIPLQGVHLFGTLRPRQVGFATTLWEWQLDGIGRFAMHATLLAILLASAWIRFDRQQIPWGLIAGGLAVTMAVSAFIPATRAWQLPTSLVLPGGVAVKMSVLLNLVGGALIGLVWWSLWQRDGIGTLGLNVYLGATLGITASLVALTFTRILCPRPAQERSATPPGPLFVAALLVLGTWWLLPLFGVG